MEIRVAAPWQEASKNTGHESLKMQTVSISPSQRVRVLQTVHTREGEWQIGVEGEVVSVESRPTGSWFAHGKNAKLWLRRLRLRKDDGELVDLVLDRDSVVTPLGGGSSADGDE